MKKIPLVVIGIFAIIFAGCNNEDSTRKYVNTDTETCKGIRFTCEEGFAPFFDDTGCGCEEDTNQTAVNECSTEYYKPVCGLLDVQCIKAPCNPAPVTYSNQCLAQQASAKDIKEGTCEELSIEPIE